MGIHEYHDFSNGGARPEDFDGKPRLLTRILDYTNISPLNPAAVGILAPKVSIKKKRGPAISATRRALELLIDPDVDTAFRYKYNLVATPEGKEPNKKGVPGNIDEFIAKMESGDTAWIEFDPHGDAAVEWIPNLRLRATRYKIEGTSPRRFTKGYADLKLILDTVKKATKGASEEDTFKPLYR